MADTIISSESLSLTWNFADGDTRAMTIKNPLPNLTKTDIKDFGSWTQQNNILIGDKAGAPLDTSKPIKKAVLKSQTKIHKDLS